MESKLKKPKKTTGKTKLRLAKVAAQHANALQRYYINQHLKRYWSIYESDSDSKDIKLVSLKDTDEA